MSDLISIIIPIYKTELYLKRCIDSIVTQSYSNIEIILVNDGSPDCSGLICDEYATKDRRIKVIHKDNGGVSSARNEGLLSANGKYVTFIDSDDYVEHDFIEYLYDLQQNNNVDMSICGHCFYNQDSKTYITGNNEILTKELALKELFYRTSYQGFLWNKLFDLENIKKNNLTFNEQITIGEDLLFVFQYITCIDQVIYGNQSKYHYVLNTNSAFYSRYSDQKFNTNNLTILEAYKGIETIIKEANLSDEMLNLLKARIVFCKVGILRNIVETKYKDYSMVQRLQDEIRKDLHIFLKSDIEGLPRKVVAIIMAANINLFGAIWKLAQ